MRKRLPSKQTSRGKSPISKSRPPRNLGTRRSKRAWAVSAPYWAGSRRTSPVTRDRAGSVLDTSCGTYNKDTSTCTSLDVSTLKQVVSRQETTGLPCRTERHCAVTNGRAHSMARSRPGGTRPGAWGSGSAAQRVRCQDHGAQNDQENPSLSQVGDHSRYEA